MKSASLEQMMADMNNGTYDLTCNGEFINSYCNAMEASRNTGVCGRNILQVANKEPYNSKGSVRKQAGGYVWKFEKESEVM